MKFILVRHGETEANANKIFSGWTDFPLTPNGIKQAEKLGEELKKYDIDVIYSSPLPRALKTAEYISKAIKKEIITTECVKEINFGLFEGKTGEQIKKEHESDWNSWNEDYVNFRLPEGENLVDVFNRIKVFIDNLKDGEKNCVIVSHSAVIQIIITYLLDLELNKIWHFQCRNGSYVEIDYENDFGFIKKLMPIDI
ncbi:phosphoserine phosphatase 1 [Gottschalkia purinilytica]|uniref:Phosphoserine phosphatase 1 n=1 Tax=Gottschalkia purinilytica TaxID=1503 RepID=A0A0L0W8W5_GOTPU|nr:histidine phosphatase family protein [Gottschalkia purinilytica]KNF07896.1 phosphoserine phosphatase 1 [Gottschalkia purinilytica]